jgi:hypothetical protein
MTVAAREARDPHISPLPHNVPRRSHARSRTARDTRRRKQWLAIGVAVTIGVITAIAADLHFPLRHTGPAKPAAAPAPITPGRTLLFAHLDAQQRADVLALIGVQPGGRSASVVLIPPPTVVEVPSLELTALRDITQATDRSVLSTSVANALGVRIDDLLVVDDARLAAMLAPVRTLDVNLPQAVHIGSGSHAADFPAGSNHLTAAQAQRLLLGKEADGAVAHLVTAQSVLQAWFDAIRTSPVLAQTTKRVAPTSDVLVSAARAGARFDALPVDSVDTGDNERYQIRDADSAALMQSDLGFATVSFAGRRPKVEILNGVGEVGISPRAARLIVPDGFEVRLTGNVPGFGVRTSEVVYYRDRDLQAARRVAALLGVGRVAKADTELDVVDLTIVVGQDFVNRHPA